MKIEDAEKLEREDFEKRMVIRFKKAADYSNEGDALANFKATAAICKVLAEYGMPIDVTTSCGVAAFYGLLKFLRRLNLYAKKVSPQNESLRDTFLDASNYLDLEKENYLDVEEGRGGEDGN